MNDPGPSLGRARRLLIYLVFLLSGASALTYEVLWTRQLTLIAGATTPAVSTILAMFMGGLALGAWIFGPIADRTSHLLKWYAALELGIGLFALVQPSLLPWMGRIYLAILPAAGANGPGVLGLRVGFSALLLLVPTLLMGGTLPILVRYVSRRAGTFGRDMGALYAMNLAGAVLGSGLTGFLFIRYLGLQGTLTLAVLTSLGVGLIAYILSTFREPESDQGTGTEATPEGGAGQPPLPARLSVLLWCTVGFSGFITMAYEVVWTRMLVFSFGSTTYSFTLILVVFLLGLTFGSMLFARFDGRISGLSTLSASHLLAAASALALAPIAANLWIWIHHASSRLGYTGGMQLAGTAFGSIAVMLLPATLMGIVFPLTSRMLIKDLRSSGRRLGRAYWTNTLGSILGALIAGYVLIPMLSIKGSLLALAGIQTLLALLFLPWTRISHRAATLFASGGLLLMASVGAAFLGLLPGPSPFDRMALVKADAPVIEAHKDDATASVTVVRNAAGERALRINGFVAAGDTKQAGYMPMMSHLPLLLQGRQAQRALVICFGTGSTAGATLLHPGAKVDVVEINPAVLAFAPWFDRANHHVYDDPRANVIIDDGRNYLASTKARYDVITSEPMPPNHAGVVNLYSREYYALARERLNPGGLMVQWLPFHLVSHQESRSILRTVQDVFPETTLWLHSFTGLIVARKGAPVSLDWASVSAAFQDGGLARDLKSLRVPSPQELAQLYALGPKAVRDLAGKAPLITDDRPSLEFHPPRHRTDIRFGPYTTDSARLMQEIYARREMEDPALVNCPPAEASALRVMRRMRNANSYGFLLLRIGYPADAADAFTEALRLAPSARDRAFCLYHLATAREAAGDRAAALDAARRSQAEDPANPQARELAGRLAASPPAGAKSGGTRAEIPADSMNPDPH